MGLAVLEELGSVIELRIVVVDIIVVGSFFSHEICSHWLMQKVRRSRSCSVCGAFPKTAKATARSCERTTVQCSCGTGKRFSRTRYTSALWLCLSCSVMTPCAPV
uniref:Uncharacterized protein n=1 Tax=Anopheles coluzzii TaxID=1518534 RepID=A0A8W7PH67_ANOCL